MVNELHNREGDKETEVMCDHDCMVQDCKGVINFNSHSSDWEDCSDTSSSVNTEPRSRSALLALENSPYKHSIHQLDDV